MKSSTQCRFSSSSRAVVSAVSKLMVICLGCICLESAHGLNTSVASVNGRRGRVLMTGCRLEDMEKYTPDQIEEAQAWEREKGSEWWGRYFVDGPGAPSFKRIGVDDNADEKSNSTDSSKGSEGKRSCFPGHAVVATPDGPMRMDQITVGSVVQDGSGGSYSEVTGFLHRSVSNMISTEYLVLEFDDNGELEISENHRIFLADGVDVFARDVKVGDHIAGDKIVRSIGHVRHDSFFSPVTESGIINVNGAVVSCYADVPHAIAHAAINWFFKYFGWPCYHQSFPQILHTKSIETSF